MLENIIRMCSLFPALLLVLIGAAAAGTKRAPALSKAYLDSGKVHLVYSDGTEAQPSGEKGQVSCEALKVAEDNQTAGWLVDFDNDGATYPIALTLVLFRDHTVTQRFGEDVDVIEDWQFRAGGKQVAFVTDAFHGGGRAHYELRGVEKGTLLAKWDGPLNRQSPAWTRGLWDEDTN